VWTVIAAFGTYFCMYGFRKPFTTIADEPGQALVLGLSFKVVLVVSQTLGYMVSKFIGIKVISEMPPHRRAMAILVLIGLAELALVGFGLVPRPWNAICLFFNGLPLGMVFGLVLGFLEGRRATEALAAGLCTSFILADGVTKSVGSWLLAAQVPAFWMPSLAGLLFAAPLLIFVLMLMRIPPPTSHDVAERAERSTLTRDERWSLFGRYWFGLTAIVVIYLLISILRSIRSDFAPELWAGLGMAAPPAIFSQSEMFVALGVLLVNGLLVMIRNNRTAFFASLGVCGAGLVLLLSALVAWQNGSLSGFPFMVLVGLGFYLPYVAVHTTVFERFLAMTRERGNLGFLMYVADSIGYLGVVGVLLSKNLLKVEGTFMHFFLTICWIGAGLSILFLLTSWIYFAVRCDQRRVVLAPEGSS
jgi:hypothetical protein